MRTDLLPLVLALALAAGGMVCSPLGRRPAPQPGQSPQTMKTKTASGKTVMVPYLLYLPPGYPGKNRRWPLMLFLHGAGERGHDLDKVKIHGPPSLIASQGQSFPFVILSPQCPADGWWSDDDQIELLDALLNDVVGRYAIDRDRLYVTGLSMGGFGTWRLAARYPQRFAAIAPICGGGDPEDTTRLVHLPVWAFHGAKDPVVPLGASQQMVDALRTAGGSVIFTVYPQAGHDSWTETYDNPALYEWFLQHRRSDEK
jgi:predicted peptidase